MERLPEFVGNHLFLISLFVAISILLFWNIFGGVMSGARLAPPAEVTTLINRDRALILDIRDAQEYESGHILSARNVPEAKLQPEIGSLSDFKERNVVVCCANGAASARAARLLRMNGFQKLHTLKGGIAAWRNEHLPLVRGAGETKET
jgi:rhodanese-related sulfurtransferase